MSRLSKVIFSIAALLVIVAASTPPHPDTITVVGVEGVLGTSEIPEASSILLLGSALVGLGGYARRRLKIRS